MSITVAAVITIKVTAKAIACPRNASPGAPSKRKRTKGAVSRSGLLGRKDVAPNSPIEIAKANAAPTPRARNAIGKSMCLVTLLGEAPSKEADSRKEGSIRLSVGITVRITNGIPKSACAIGTKIHEDLRSKGGVSKEINIPKPKTTADTPKGSIMPKSKKLESQRFP